MMYLQQNNSPSRRESVHSNHIPKEKIEMDGTCPLEEYKLQQEKLTAFIREHSENKKPFVSSLAFAGSESRKKKKKKNQSKSKKSIKFE